MANYQGSFNIIEPYREVWVCVPELVPELVNKTIILDVLWFFRACKSLTLDTLFSAHSKRWKLKKKHETFTHTFPSSFELEPPQANTKSQANFNYQTVNPPKPSHPGLLGDWSPARKCTAISFRRPKRAALVGCGPCWDWLWPQPAGAAFFQNIGVVSHKHPPEAREFLSLDPPTKNSCANATVELGGGGSINTWIMMMDQLLFYLPASNKLKTLDDDSSNQIPQGWLGNFRKSLGMMFIILTPPAAYKLTQSVEVVLFLSIDLWLWYVYNHIYNCSHNK